jgi:hypothetical protein
MAISLKSTQNFRYEASECGLTRRSRRHATAWSREAPLSILRLAGQCRCVRLSSSVRHPVDVVLALSEDNHGRRSLSTDLVFDRPAKILNYVWRGTDMWWVKSPEWSTHYHWAVQYHHLRDGSRQVIVNCGAVLQHCIASAAVDPDCGCESAVDWLRPSVLYRKGQHGVGLVAVPDGAAEALRNGIWRLKSSHVNEALAKFSSALAQGRGGSAKRFSPDA